MVTRCGLVSISRNLINEIVHQLVAPGNSTMLFMIKVSTCVFGNFCHFAQLLKVIVFVIIINFIIVILSECVSLHEGLIPRRGGTGSGLVSCTTAQRTKKCMYPYTVVVIM